ncbi:dienelactone hydrolase family protein [Nocardia sp. BMG111209]|uniref:dienelactone hydrolase family protein n=1 Tax=Nocardia sp. BMG111209 TaxID=1160137 RepID=UPI00037A4E64|nr:dienelactone hydrolase family protein [Nocardia sp. BMG111209]
MTAVQGDSVDIQTPDGVADAYLAHPDDGAAHPAVLLFVDAFGLRPATRQIADRLAAGGYTVLVPNVFYRHGRAPVVDLPDFIDHGDRTGTFAKIGPIMQSLTTELAMRDAGAYLQWLADDPRATDGPVGLTGYCMGARLVLLTAGTYPDRVAAAAGFHGGRLATDDPHSPHLVVDRVTAELYFGHADQDQSMPPEQIERLNKALDQAGVRYRAEVYAGATHGYTMPDTSVYQEEGAERHYTELLALFGRRL